MNLHDIKIHGEQWLWMQVYNGNGRFLGHHLWLVPEGTPPTEELVRATDISDRYGSAWQILRRTVRHWGPYNQGATTLFLNRWTRPLCGFRTTSRRASWYFSDEYSRLDLCGECTRVAEQRNYQPLFRQHATPSHENANDVLALMMRLENEHESGMR